MAPSDVHDDARVEIDAEDVATPLPPETGRLSPGTVLNNIWQVRRFYASGGMSEIYEGRHINTDERVAIKVLREHLALDPKVRGVLLSEARKMTRIRHDAVVHYIMMAEEPGLGVSYIVMDFIDGVGLDKMIGLIRPTQDEIMALIRRLAEGLRAAHERGVFHRDLSPDNILLPDRRLAEAKIIDFGIAKDVSLGASTIVGGGFAGKIGFAAPEQFGEFDSQVGPWTDIYSVGLVMLSLALGRIVEMGSTLVEAVDRRRAGPDLGGLAPGLRPTFERMLTADPQARFQTMDALIAALNAVASANGGQTSADAAAAGSSEPGMTGIAISYAPGDRALAEKVIRGLRALGAEVWWDEDVRDVDWPRALERRIGALSGVVVLWTPNSVASSAIQDEAHLAISHGKLVNVLGGVSRAPAPFDEARRLFLDGWTPPEPHPGWTGLVQAVEALCVRSDSARPGEYTGVLVQRERELAAKQQALAGAQAALQETREREREAAVTAAGALAALARAEDDLRRVMEAQVSPSILRAAQQEFDGARQVQATAEREHEAAKDEVGGASRELAKAKSERDTVLMDAARPPVRSTQGRAARVAAAAEPRPLPSSAPFVVPPREANVGLSTPAKRPDVRWIAVAGVVGLTAIVTVGGTVLALRHNSVAAHATPALQPIEAPDAPARDPAAAAEAAITGKWTLQNVSCDYAIQFQVQGGALSIGGATVKIASVDPNGVIRTGASGRYAYAVSGDTLTMTAANGERTSYTRCAG